MLISIEQRPGKLIISYVKKDGTIGFTQLVIPASHQYIYAYAQKNKGIPGLLSWDFKPVRKIATQFINRHRIQEFFMDAGEDVTGHLFEANMPILSACDIEVDVTDEGFAEPSTANNRINSISFSQYPDIVTFGNKILSGEECVEIERGLNEHISKSNKKYNFIYKYHKNEADMLYDFLYNYARQAILITGWNFWGYDWRYMMNRCKKLNLNVDWLSPTGQWFPQKIKDHNESVEIMLPQHKLIIDYMAIYQKWDRTIEVKENDTLDFVSEESLGIKKLQYSGNLQDMYNKDFVKYILYNCIDTVLIELLDLKLKTMATFLGLGNITRVEAMTAFSPIAMLEATLTRYAYKRGQIFPKKEESKEREQYEGAFVFEPIRGIYPWVAIWDFASLYPSIMRQFKISVENFLFKDKNYEPKDNQIKTYSGAVFDASYDPLLSTILTDYYTQRKDAKKVSLLAEKEADELKKILKQRKKEVNKQIN